MTASNSSVPVAPLPGWVCAMIGGVSGTVEVCINQPMVSWKNALQQGQPISFSPAVMYRGTLVNATSIAPITAIQFGVAGALTKVLAGDGRQLTNSEKLGTSLAGGAVSAVIVCPADMIIIQQQKSGFSLMQQVNSIVNQHGAFKLSKGLLPAIGRESLFVGGYLGLAPIVRSMLVAAKPDMFANEAGPISAHGEKEGNFASLVVSAMLAGSAAGVLTHPIDTVKTRLQSDLAGTVYNNARQTSKLIYQESGIRGFYNGVLPRTGRICVAVLIFNECNRIFGSFARSLGLAETQKVAI